MALEVFRADRLQAVVGEGDEPQSSKRAGCGGHDSARVHERDLRPYLRSLLPPDGGNGCSFTAAEGLERCEAECSLIVMMRA
ncbi:hypothetical protein, partial [Nonomuraea jabiensis]|uniref:hypothetical protein n=1 Tax=Nonomuraea jabiensis TaxID=882448 RepID=UPI003D757B55